MVGWLGWWVGVVEWVGAARHCTGMGWKGTGAGLGCLSRVSAGVGQPARGVAWRLSYQ